MKLYIFTAEWIDDGGAVVVASSETEAREMMFKSHLESWPMSRDTSESLAKEYYHMQELAIEKGVTWL